MTDSSGVLVDDGVAAYISREHFYITATSSHAHAVVKQLRLFAIQLNLHVLIVDRTRQMGAINLAGPFANQVLQPLTDLRLNSESFPYLGVRDALVAGIKSRIMRVGFVGELGYEIHAPAHSLKHLWLELSDAGKKYNIAPFGVEAQRLLRLEKGHLIFGQDTDGMTTPYEVNLGWGVKLTKEKFLGRHSLKELKPLVARKLVGFQCKAESRSAIDECNLLIENGNICGRVTSTSYSPHLKATIGLAMLETESSPRDGKILIKNSTGAMIQASIVDLPFFDPKNLRQNETLLDSQI
jgi:sarcosine oxidase subunit alpha